MSSKRELSENTPYPVALGATWPVLEIAGGTADIYTGVSVGRPAGSASMVKDLEEATGHHTLVGDVGWILWKAVSGSPKVRLRGGDG